MNTNDESTPTMHARITDDHGLAIRDTDVDAFVIVSPAGDVAWGTHDMRTLIHALARVITDVTANGT